MLKKGVTIVICFLIIFNLVIITIPETTKAIRAPVVELKWAKGQEVQWADVGPGQSGLVTFTGTVSADLAAGGMTQVVYVNLRGSNDQGWPVTVTPSFMELNPGTEEKAISVTVEVTPGTDTNESGIVIVSGDATASPGGGPYHIPPITGTIKINQYYRHVLTSDRLSKPVIQGDELDFNLNVRNIGNGPTQSIITIYDSEKPKNWKLTLDNQGRLELDPKSSNNLSLKVETAATDNPGKYEILLALQLDETLDQDNSSIQVIWLNVFVKYDYYYPLTISFFIIVIIIISVLVFKSIQVRKKSIKKFYQRRIQPIKPEPPPRIPPPGKDHVRW